MRKRISRLHCITWDGASRDHVEQVRLLLDAGADWVQLRQKTGDYAQKLAVARQAKVLCEDAGATLIINDDVQLCLDSEAHGVHLGLLDMPIAEARARMGRFAIIGGTANTPEQVLQRYQDGADYVGLGPWRYTGTKQNLSPVLGSEGIKAALAALAANNAELPVIAIGGITPADVQAILQLGVHGIAVSSALVAVSDVDRAFTEFYFEMNQQGK
jgi:thiamine-phosphate pyrophosphorylase